VKKFTIVPNLYYTTSDICGDGFIWIVALLENMIIDEIKEKVGKNRYEYTLHAEIERKTDDLTVAS
jgi:hypothetical protein